MVVIIPLYFSIMASINQMYEVIHAIRMGFESEIRDCMYENTGIIEGLIREQIYAGQNGNGKLLNPTYENDPFFEEKGRWYHRNKQYKHWKEKITPPITSEVLFLPPRPVEVPNLFITGRFHDSITALKSSDGISITTKGFTAGKDIVSKYGDSIFMLGKEGKSYFSHNILRPWLERFIKKCGYR